MADSKLSALTAITDPDGRHRLYGIDETPTSGAFYLADVNVLPEGYMLNGKVSVTVTSNNITVALKTKSGNNPSATDPVSVWMNGSYRRCTASLSVTKNALTNWFNSGATELATLEQDYFVHLIWNTTPGTDIMDIGFARIPYGRVYSDFSGTTTNEKYLAFANASTPTSTDDCVVIGRFAATLSATASFNWSVPTFTNSNLIQYPVFETRWLSWTPTLTGFSANPTITGQYKITGSELKWVQYFSAIGTSNATTSTMLMPFAAANISNSGYVSAGRGQDNGTECSPTYRLLTNTNSMDVFKGPGHTAWTNSGTKFFVGEGFYNIK